MPDLKQITSRVQFRPGGMEAHSFDHRHVHYEINAEGLVYLTFDREDSPANIFDEATFEELEDVLSHLEGHKELSGLVLRSAKEKIFVAGADLKELSKCVHGPATDRDTLKSFIRRGQAAFNRIEALPVPKVALIHGVCLGGGLEIALACDWRIASNAKATKIGLPETQLGILPAWGGSTRLPKLIGLDKALGIVVPGKQMAAGKAKSLGIVDEVVNCEQLDEAAHRFISRGRRTDAPFFPANLSGVRNLIASFAKKKTLAKTRGNYPAQERVIDVMRDGLAEPLEKSLQNELHAVLDLGATNACRNLLHLFFLQEGAKKSKLSLETTRDARSIEHVAVIGAGIMGAGIAQWSAARGCEVLLKDVSADALAKGMGTVRKRFDEAEKRRLMTKPEIESALSRVTPVSDDVSLHSRDLVIEAAVEKLDIKKLIFEDLAKTAGDNTILATNTSALPIEEIANATLCPERVIGLHFFNPVHRMPLIEVIYTSKSDPDVVNDAVAFVRRIGKTPVVAKDSPGFIVNRILMPYLIEAGYLFSRHVAADRIDKVMLDFGMPMGPLRLLDEVGLDVALHVANTLSEAMPGRFTTPDVLVALVESGSLGRKSGSGFYLYDADSKGDKLEVNPKALAACADSPETGVESDNALRWRLSLLMCNEALLCLEEGVASSPGDIDLAMILGTGYAPFVGGPLRHCETRGLSRTADQLHELWETTGREIFKPAEYLRLHDTIFKHD